MTETLLIVVLLCGQGHIDLSTSCRHPYYAPPGGFRQSFLDPLWSNSWIGRHGVICHPHGTTLLPYEHGARRPPVAARHQEVPARLPVRGVTVQNLTRASQDDAGVAGQ